MHDHAFDVLLQDFLPCTQQLSLSRLVKCLATAIKSVGRAASPLPLLLSQYDQPEIQVSVVLIQ